jgi:methylamine dehydrogenase accessory protein MauD
MSMTALTVMVVVLFAMVLGLSIAVFALSRQVGILFERVAPMGALIIDAGPKVGAASPLFEVPTLSGGKLKLGGASERSTLLFFLSPTCPVCKKLLPVLRSMRPVEAQWLSVVLASDGDAASHERFAQANHLQTFPYVLSTELGVGFRVSRLPFAVLIDEQGIVRAKGLINNREQLESLFSAKELGIESIQSYLEQAA